jgi:hypothetical protein
MEGLIRCAALNLGFLVMEIMAIPILTIYTINGELCCQYTSDGLDF